MWDILKDAAKNYRSTVIKLSIALFFIFMIVQYNTYGKRSSAHALFIQINSGMIGELCVAPSRNIKTDRNGVYALVDEEKIYIPDAWGNLTQRDNLFIAIIMGEGRMNRKVYEVDYRNAKSLILEDDRQGCKDYSNMKRKTVF